MKAIIGLPLVLGALAALPLARADERPPADGITVLKVLDILEDQGYGPVTEVSFDDGVWEVEAYKGKGAFEVTIDPENGEIISEHRDEGDPQPPKDAMPLAKLIAKLEKAGYADLNDISFERKTWEVEATRDGQKRELRVDPKDGNVISDRVDD